MMQTPFHLTDKVILVTGASSGIGRSIAVECARMGARVVLNGRNEARLNETISLMMGEGHQIVAADLSDREGIAALVKVLPTLDGVVCCAGIASTVVLKQSDEADMRQVFDVNTFSIICLVRMLLEEKLLRKGASVVLMSSISGVYCGYVGGTLYGASKAALQGLMKAMALEVAPRQIRVNTINPGMVDTALLDGENIGAEQIAEDVKRYPLKRYGKPEDVAYAAVYLLSEATVWMTGSSLLIDGGYTLQ